jgi:hypothetical protein
MKEITMTLYRLRIALAVTMLALAALSAAPAVAGEDSPIAGAPASGGRYGP